MEERQHHHVDSFVGGVLRESTIHGVKYMGTSHLHTSEKIFWGISVAACLAFSIYMVANLYEKFTSNPVIISFQPTETPISRIPFPAITICNVNIMKRQKMKEIYDILVKELEKSNVINDTTIGPDLAKAYFLAEHLSHFCLAAPSFRRIIKEKLFDAAGEMDFVTELQEFLVLVGKQATGPISDLEYEFLMDQTSDFTRGASHACEDMILRCMWARQNVSCNEYFTSIHTQHGTCCVFNMMPRFILRKNPHNDSHSEKLRQSMSEDVVSAWKSFDLDTAVKDPNEPLSDYPMHQRAGGKPYGLTILVNPEMDVYSTCTSYDSWGFKMITHSPISFPPIADYGMAIPPQSEVFVDIEPHVTIADENMLKYVDVKKRACYLHNDTDVDAKLDTYNFYTALNCLDECVAQQTFETCGCVRHFMPKNASQQLCGANKLNCADQVRVSLASAGKSNKCKKCLPACTDIKYNMRMSSFPLRADINLSLMYSTPENADLFKNATNFSIIHIYLGTDSLYAKERKRLYDAADLLASGGGLLGLALGVSFISFIEIIYFCTLRAWFYYRSGNEEDEDDEDDDEDVRAYKSRMKAQQREIKNTTAAVPPFARKDIQKLQMNGYYNWSMDQVRTRQISVESQNPTKRIPDFNLLSGSNPIHFPYLS